ncbi:MAG: 5-formyltetrahydrofolate cyclo-ligase [Bacteroidales bacterium]|nr:5-formyltetrahydrofolate cyclo-ligase [Bacteroidales bacterium]
MEIDKNALRRRITILKKKCPAEEIRRQSESVFQQVEAMPQFLRASVILIYWAMPDEIQTRGFIHAHCRDKTFLLPVMEGDHLLLKPFRGEQYLVRHPRRNIYEPQGNCFDDVSRIQLVIVPGMAFDAEGHRLGRGRGYYDRLLPQLSAYKIGVGFDFQLIRHVPCNAHDVPMDNVIVGQPAGYDGDG